MPAHATLIAVSTAAASCGATWALLPILRRKAILDHPTERASHTIPTPRGGGIAVVSVTVLAWSAAAFMTEALSPSLLTALGGAVALAVLSWLDDLADLSALVRLAGHAAAVAAGLAALPDGILIFQGLLPEALDKVLAALAWIWFVNLFNFMDGIDGISGVEIMAIGAGVFALAATSAVTPALGLLGVGAAGAAVGFLVFNWQPAKIFLGDVGSVPMGFLLGWLLLSLAGQGLWAPALILPLYYLADATLTLGRRALRGEKVWRAHKEHFYQRAHQAGLSHAAVSTRIAVANGLLIGCALLAAQGKVWPGLICGVGVVSALLGHFATQRGRSAP